MKLYILEDEMRIMQHILQIVRKITYLEVVGHTDQISIAANEIPKVAPDIVLADIRLKDGNSFQLFQEIGLGNFQVVFLTAYDHYAIQALNLGAFGYLLKPIDEIALNTIFNKCFQYRGQEGFTLQQLAIAKSHYASQGTGNNGRIALKNVECIEIVAISDVVFCKSDKGYTTFYLQDGKEILVSKGLKEYESVLSPFGFLRCHQSYLVNFNYVKKYYRDGYLEVINKLSIPVSARKKEEVLKYLEHMA